MEKTFDAEGNPVEVTREETEAGVVEHVEPAEANETGVDITDPDDVANERHEGAETGKKGMSSTNTEDDDERPF